MTMHRRTVWQFLALCATGCAVDRGPLQFPEPRPLITPESGKAILYLLRIPREPFELVVNVDGARTALLPKETFTAISLPPGRHELLAVHPNTAIPTAPAIITLAEGERRFLYSAVPSKGSLSTAFVPIGAAIVPIFTPTQTPTGARRWVEMNEFDAQGMMSVLQTVGAEANAP
jgi:hypothetical protein